MDGLATRVEGGPEAARLRSLIDGVPGATNIGELGIGLNPAARISDDITESKKRLGTAHLALGDNAGGYGGVVESPVHLDGMLLNVSVWIDGTALILDGQYPFFATGLSYWPSPHYTLVAIPVHDESMVEFAALSEETAVADSSTAPAAALPRYASITRGSRCTSVGVPSAIFCP